MNTKNAPFAMIFENRFMGYMLCVQASSPKKAAKRISAYVKRELNNSHSVPEQIVMWRYSHDMQATAKAEQIGAERGYDAHTIGKFIDWVRERQGRIVPRNKLSAKFIPCVEVQEAWGLGLLGNDVEIADFWHKDELELAHFLEVDIYDFEPDLVGCKAAPSWA